MDVKMKVCEFVSFSYMFCYWICLICLESRVTLVNCRLRLWSPHHVGGEGDTRSECSCSLALHTQQDT